LPLDESFGPGVSSDLPRGPAVCEDVVVSKKSRGRRHSIRDLEPATSSDAGEPSVFGDMEVEDGRLPDGRRILYFSWPGEEDESPTESRPGEAAAVSVVGTVDATASADTSPEEPSVDDQPVDV
jgi:hypothetical protein